MKIYATRDNRNYFNQFVGTDIWVECEDTLLEHDSIYKHQYFKFVGSYFDDPNMSLGGYNVVEIPSIIVNTRSVNKRDFDNYLHSGCMWASRVGRMKPTGNFLTDEEIYGSVGAEE